MPTLSSLATVLVFVFSAGSISTGDPPDLTSSSRFSTLANSSSTAPPPTSAKHTTKRAAAKHTTKRAAAKHTTKPSAAKHTTKPSAAKHTTKPSAAKASTKPSAAKAATPPAPRSGTADLPSDVLDLRNWYLTLPTGTAGDPDTVNQPALDTYTGAAFHLNDAKNGVVFTTNAGGVTTSRSTYPRSELREMNGTAKASWSNQSGTHTLVVRQAVTQLPAVKPELVTAQIHDTVSDVMEVRLEGKRLLAQYNDGKSDITIDPAYVLGTVFEVRIVAAGSKVQVYYNGVLKATINASGSGWYFKSGSYLQSNTSRGDKPTAAGVVVTYALDVTHS